MPGIPAEPIESPAAWRGSSLGAEGDWLYTLSADEVTELKAAVAHVRSKGLCWADVTREEFPLTTMSDAIAGWARQIDKGLGFIQIKGFPARDLSEEEVSILYWGIGLHLGRPVAQNTDGDLLGHVRDTGADPEDKSVRLYKTRAKQDFHADGADIIGLMCLQPSLSGGESKLASSVTIFNEVMRRRPDLVPIFFETFCFDRHEQQGPGEKGWWEMPISQYKDGDLTTWFAEWYIREAQRFDEVPRLTKAQDELVRLIPEIANDRGIHITINFEVGDMQFLKNSVVLHSREAYEDYPEPERRRHLLRLWLLREDFVDGHTGLKTVVV